VIRTIIFGCEKELGPSDLRRVNRRSAQEKNIFHLLDLRKKGSVIV
jgi:hypothetical protein